ncbi:hypothetical protein [Acidisoma sp. 7E03]
MTFVPSLRLLSSLGEVRQDDGEITLPIEAFRALLQAAFRGDAFDAAWYRSAYPDVADAIAAGDVPDPFTHFTRSGYLEHRRPRPFAVDRAWYEKTYQDVAKAVKMGAVTDAETHFNTAGYFEPRAPDPGTARAFAHLLEAAAARTQASQTAPAAKPASAPATPKRRRAAG